MDFGIEQSHCGCGEVFVIHLRSFLPLAVSNTFLYHTKKNRCCTALMHLLDFDKIVSELGVINQTDACVVLKRNQEAVG